MFEDIGDENIRLHRSIVVRRDVTEIQNRSGFDRNFLKYCKNVYIRFIFNSRRLENCLDIIISKIILENQHT